MKYNAVQYAKAMAKQIRASTREEEKEASNESTMTQPSSPLTSWLRDCFKPHPRAIMGEPYTITLSNDVNMPRGFDISITVTVTPSSLPSSSSSSSPLPQYRGSIYDTHSYHTTHGLTTNTISTISPNTTHSYTVDFDGFPQEQREQALRDYKVTIEYKHLKSHAPGGVYLIPSLKDLRHFYGVIFVRRGPFTNGIFKFELTLPRQYNDFDQHPQIVFSSKVYNPYIFPDGRLDLESAYPRWDPSRQYLVTALTFLKKIFYAKSFTDARANLEAKEMSINDPQKYHENVEDCVRESQRHVFVNPDESTARFTEEQLSHRVLRDLLKQNVKDPMQASKNAILSMIEKASRV
jgi:ubiquitin-protein ligase